MNTRITTATIEALKNGEHKAFDTVFIVYFNRVKQFISALIRSESEAEELTQDIFAKIWIKRESLDTGHSFDSFIYTVARNASYNYLKHKFIRNNYAEKPLEEEKVDSPEELLFAKEISLLVEMTVCQMPENRRTIYRLSRNEGLSNEDIAAKLNISKKTVENNISLALKEIRKIISITVALFL